MQIYTSYFANIRKLRNSGFNGVFISIAGYTPNWFTGGKCTALAPRKQWWQEWKNRFGKNPESRESIDFYTEQYMNTVLARLQPYQLINDLERLYGDKIVLTCYEIPDKFCHRHIVRSWLNESGINCTELLSAGLNNQTSEI